MHEFETRVRAYCESKPYTRVIDLHSDGVNHAHKIKLTTELPDIVIDVATDAAANLRAALDQMGAAAAVAGGVANPKRSQFPIADSESDLRDGVIGRGNCKHLPDEILSLFVSFKPYKGGNNAIWAINKIANGTKHALLVPVDAQVGHSVYNLVATGGGLVSIGSPWDYA
ncbi:MAG TPA: hypothetical protein VME92_01345, partial [Acetobacteraceae bacterium]|nr:hypothetical protein [Acetobacteraceae bacterium]